MNPDTKEALEEALYDLKHDLGKYIRLPVSMLPRNASWNEVAAQVEQAVLRTRKSPGKEISAAMLFETFAAEWGERLEKTLSYPQVALSVLAANALPDRIRQNDQPLTREAVEKILGNVSVSIQLLIDEVLHG